MKGLNKKILGRVLLFVFTCQLFAPSAFAAVDSASIVNEVGYVLEYIDGENDRSSINGAYNAIRDLTLTTETESAISGLLTSSFVSKFPTTDAAKNALLNILSESIAVYYTADAQELEKALVTAENAIKDDFFAVFGENADITKWFDLFVLTKKDAQLVADYNAKRIWALGSKIELYDVMDELQNETVAARLEMTAYADIKSVIDALGWTAESLTVASRKLVNKADANNIGEFALLKAAARSSAKVYDVGMDNADITPALAGRYHIENADKYEPESVPADTTIKLSVLGTDVTNLVGYVSTNTDVATITPNEVDKTFTIEYTGNKGTTEIILFRDPLGDNSGITNDWLVRWCVSVINVIDKTSKPVWGTDENEGKISWEAVEGAVKYTVKLYKGNSDVPVKTVEGVTDTTYDFNSLITGNGSYTVTVQAFGDVEGETGAVSDRSDPYVVDSFLEAPDAPVWQEVVDPQTQEIENILLEWDEVPGADSYTVRIYTKGSSQPVGVTENITATSCDFTSFFQNKTGSYYATVEAVNATSSSGESARSSAYICKATVTGVIKLQGGEGKVYKSDNSGVIVTVSNYPNIKAITDESGAFTLAGLPVDREGKTFELKFDFVKEVNGVEVRSYLSATKIITASSTAVNFNNGNPFMLYYGDFNGQDGIGAQDLSYLIKRIGYSQKEHVEYAENPYVDCTGDGAIQMTELFVILQNVGKTSTNAYK